MTKNITMAIEETLLKKARKIAVDKDTTVTGLIRTYLTHLVEQEEKSKHEIIRELSDLLNHSRAEMGEKTWTREELHER